MLQFVRSASRTSQVTRLYPGARTYQPDPLSEVLEKFLVSWLLNLSSGCRRSVFRFAPVPSPAIAKRRAAFSSSRRNSGCSHRMVHGRLQHVRIGLGECCFIGPCRGGKNSGFRAQGPDGSFCSPTGSCRTDASQPRARRLRAPVRRRHSAQQQLFAVPAGAGDRGFFRTRMSAGAHVDFLRGRQSRRKRAGACGCPA